MNKVGLQFSKGCPSIMATIGPASSSKNVLKKMVENGMDIARLNFYFGNHDGKKVVIDTIREVEKITGKKVLILQDLAGDTKVRDEFSGKKTHTVSSELTRKDKRDVLFAIKNGVDVVAISLIKTAAQVRSLKNFLKEHSAPIPVIAKIETVEALKNLKDIIKESDGIMIARGDLGDALQAQHSYGDLPLIQLAMTKMAKKEGKPVIAATELLSSLLYHKRASRAEVTDINMACWWGSDSLMLAEEAAISKNPAKVVKEMKNLIEVACKNYSSFASSKPESFLAHYIKSVNGA